MKKQIFRITVAFTLLFSFFTPVFASAAYKLEVPELEIPELDVPDNMPDVSESLREKYESALEGLIDEGFGENNYIDGLGELELPEGFGREIDPNLDAESIFAEKFGNINANHGQFNQNLLNKGRKGKPDKEEMKNYMNHLTNKYERLFQYKKVVERDKVFNSIKIKPFEASSKWEAVLETPEEAMNRFSNIQYSAADKEKMIKNREKPANFEENLKLHEDAENKYNETEGRFSEVYTEPDGYKNWLFKQIGTAAKKIGSFGKSITNGIKNLFGKGDSKVEDLAEQQIQTDADIYRDYFKKYYYEKDKSESKERSEQRHKILDVFEKHGIYDRRKDKKATDEEYIGKLIYDNMDLLKKEIPDLKEYESK